MKTNSWHTNVYWDVNIFLWKQNFVLSLKKKYVIKELVGSDQLTGFLFQFLLRAAF